MRYFIDTEFAERPCAIDLISIGIVSDDGREFYAEVNGFDPFLSNEWVKENVLPCLWSRQRDNAWSRAGVVGGFLTRLEIRNEVLRFIGDDTPEFWGYFAGYDWVVFCWLFGQMADLPKGWPMYCRDIKQWADQLGGAWLPGQSETEHNALHDARWNKEAWERLCFHEASILDNE